MRAGLHLLLRSGSLVLGGLLGSFPLCLGGSLSFLLPRSLFLLCFLLLLSSH